MSCTQNINKFIVPNDVIRTLTEIYKYIGKNDNYKEIASQDYNRIVSQTVERDAYFLSKLIDLDISDARLRLIITKNSESRNREERILCNIKEILSTFLENPNVTTLSSSDLNNLINYIYPNQNIKYDNVKEEKKNYYHLVTGPNKREIIDQLFDFIKSLDMLYERIDGDYESYSDSILSILGEDNNQDFAKEIFKQRDNVYVLSRVVDAKNFQEFYKEANSILHKTGIKFIQENKFKDSKDFFY